MEENGCAFDAARCKTSSAVAASDAQALLGTWESYAPGVNPGSPKQLVDLFQSRKFPIPPVTGTLKAVAKNRDQEKYPTGEAAVDWLLTRAKRPENVRLLETLLEWRKVSKLAQFLEKLPTFLCRDGFLRASFGPDTGTGRLSSRNPNLQNIPAGKADRYGIRKCFIAPRGETLLVSDYSALEPRILAHFLIRLFDDHTLAEALASGDLYGAIAKSTWPSALAGVGATEIKDHPNPVLKAYRSQAKIIVLSTNYLKSVGGIALQLGVDTATATRLRADYFNAYPGIPRFQAWAASCARTTGRVPTLLGRYRELPEIHSKDKGDQAKAERQAVNSVIQGSAADIVMLAMVNQRNIPGAKLQLQVHDELVWRVEDVASVPALCEAMTRPTTQLDLAVPLTVDYHTVSDWGSAK